MLEQDLDSDMALLASELKRNVEMWVIDGETEAQKSVRQ
jgi:hypothetical protein